MHDIKELFGKRVKALRNSHGISQEEFAFRANLNRTYITSLERGQRNVSLENIEKIAEAFEMTISELLNF